LRPIKRKRRPLLAGKERKLLKSPSVVSEKRKKGRMTQTRGKSGGLLGEKEKNSPYITCLTAKEKKKGKPSHWFPTRGGKEGREEKKLGGASLYPVLLFGRGRIGVLSSLPRRKNGRETSTIQETLQ